MPMPPTAFTAFFPPPSPPPTPNWRDRMRTRMGTSDPRVRRQLGAQMLGAPDLFSSLSIMLGGKNLQAQYEDEDRKRELAEEKRKREEEDRQLRRQVTEMNLRREESATEERKRQEEERRKEVRETTERRSGFDEEVERAVSEGKIDAGLGRMLGRMQDRGEANQLLRKRLHPTVDVELGRRGQRQSIKSSESLVADRARRAKEKGSSDPRMWINSLLVTSRDNLRTIDKAKPVGPDAYKPEKVREWELNKEIEQSKHDILVRRQREMAEERFGDQQLGVPGPGDVNAEKVRRAMEAMPGATPDLIQQSLVGRDLAEVVRLMEEGYGIQEALRRAQL